MTLAARSAAQVVRHTPPGGPVFEVNRLGFSYAGAPRPTLDGIEFSVEPGTVHGIIGPNGSGKSTLLKLLLGTLRPESGELRYGGRPVGSWPRRELARMIGVVPQREEIAFPLSVRELVAMGRYPRLRTWQREGATDRRAVDYAMQRCQILDLADRMLDTLSGGELQRARIARALAQEPETLVLDEPTAALDIRHEMAIFELIAELAREGATIVVVTHNLNLAARYADQLILLDRGRTASLGRPDHVLVRKTIERVYGWPITLAAHPGPGPDTGAPQVVPLSGSRTTSTAASTEEDRSSMSLENEGITRTRESIETPNAVDTAAPNKAAASTESSSRPEIREKP
jgi:iron complex transport system ATP-binding protein